MGWKEYFIPFHETWLYNEKPVHGPGFKDTKGKIFPKGVRIPDPAKYDITVSPDLMYTRDRLAARGLKDPWIRNEIWRFDPKYWGTRWERILFPLRPVKYAVCVFLITLGIEKMFSHPHEHHEDKYKMLYEMDLGYKYDRPCSEIRGMNTF